MYFDKIFFLSQDFQGFFTILKSLIEIFLADGNWAYMLITCNFFNTNLI